MNELETLVDEKFRLERKLYDVDERIRVLKTRGDMDHNAKTTFAAAQEAFGAIRGTIQEMGARVSKIESLFNLHQSIRQLRGMIDGIRESPRAGASEG